VAKEKGSIINLRHGAKAGDPAAFLSHFERWHITMPLGTVQPNTSV
jgi:hypothetical protein